MAEAMQERELGWPREAGPVLDLRRTASSEAVCITFICLLDLSTTIFWVAMGQAREGNPLMAYFLSLGAVPFIVAKIATFAPAVMAAEWYRPYNPGLISRLLRWVIVGYLVTYIAGVAGHQGRVVEFYSNMLLS